VSSWPETENGQSYIFTQAEYLHGGFAPDTGHDFGGIRDAQLSAGRRGKEILA
jgi:hypothetical protein